MATLPADAETVTVPGAAELLAALPTPTLLLDSGNRIAGANAAAEMLFNTAQGLMRGRPLGALLSVNDIPALQDPDQAVAAYDIDIQLPGARRQRGDLLIAPIGEHPGWRVISIQTRAAASLVDRQQGRTGATLAAVGAAAMLAHEIKNPLSGIRGAAQLLDDGQDEERRVLTRLICDEVDRVAALVDRMEGFTDTRTRPVEAQNIHAILSHVRVLGSRGFADALTIREQYDPSIPAVAGFQDALIQIFLNLLKNAAEVLEGRADGEILLTTAYRHGLSVAARSGKGRVALPIEVCVIDNGPGAPAVIADHLFDPFVSSKPSGGGLGLALVAKLVADHGGVVEYGREGDPPRTMFRVLLPRFQEKR